MRGGEDALDMTITAWLGSLPLPAGIIDGSQDISDGSGVLTLSTGAIITNSPPVINDLIAQLTPCFKPIAAR
jgi:hypothetical protein